MSEYKEIKIPVEELLSLAQEENPSVNLIWETQVPAFRSFDIKKDVDLIEEILRIYGYTNVEPLRPDLPMNVEIQKPFEEKIRNLLTDRGLNEVITFPWIEESLRELFNLPSYWEIVNPLNTQQRHMRTSLIPSLVKVQQFNQNNFNRDVAIFELGKIYLENQEVPTLGILAVGKFEKHFTVQRDWDFLTFKGIVEALLTRLGVENYKIEPEKRDYMHPYLCAKVVADGQTLGYFGKLHPSVAQKLELKETPYVGEFNLELLRDLRIKPTFKGLSKFPPARRDFAFVFKKEDNFADQILQTAKEVFSDLLEEIFVFDVYEGENIGKENLSVAVRVILRHPERSLSDEEVNKLSEEFLKRMQEKGFRPRA